MIFLSIILSLMIGRKLPNSYVKKCFPTSFNLYLQQAIYQSNPLILSFVKKACFNISSPYLRENSIVFFKIPPSPCHVIRKSHSLVIAHLFKIQNLSPPRENIFLSSFSPITNVLTKRSHPLIKAHPFLVFSPRIS